MPPARHYPEPTVGALIFDPSGRLFLMRSHKWGGRYVVPGGHVELGETLEAALRREVAEETGLTIHDIRFVCTQEFIYDPAFGRRPPTRLAAPPLHLLRLRLPHGNNRRPPER